MLAIDDHRPFPRVRLAAGAGLLTALSVPPWGFWPLGAAGIGLLAVSLADARLRRRLIAGLAFGAGLFGPTLFWMGDFHAVGYLAVVLLETSFFVAAAALTPPGRGRGGWRLCFPAAVVLAEAARGVVPFGGLPMGGLPLGQAGGPIVPAARLGGGLLLTAMVAVAGLALVDAAAAARAGQLRHARRPAVLLAAIALITLGGILAPDGRGSGRPRPLDVAVVQGGGPRGFRAVESEPAKVLEAHLAASRHVNAPVDLVVWPENTIDVAAIDGSPAGAALADLARRLDATVVAGVTEEVGADNFRNVAVAWSPAGEIVDRYVKVHRVPFGEYVPGRRLFDRLVDLTVLPRDAVAGTGPSAVSTPAGRLGVAISFEVFFGGQGRAAARAGGEVLLVPTNASSYTSSQVPSQELAASRLQAWATGRWVVQSAPTGFGAIVDPEGRVIARTRLGTAEVLQGRVELQDGRTLYVRWGDRPILLLSLVALGVGWARERRRPTPAGVPSKTEPPPVTAATAAGSDQAASSVRRPCH